MQLAWNFAFAALLCTSLGGCSADSTVIDPFPISMDLSKGPVVLLASDKGDIGPVEIVVDVLSPITILDSYRPGGEVPKPERRLVELTLFGLTASGQSVPRVRFPQTPAYDVHACDRPDSTAATCRVGLDGNTQDIYGILGSDILSRSSVRFDFPLSQLRFFPDAAGSDSERTLACDAVFTNPYHGGGKLLISGNEVSYSGHRPTLGACIHSELISEPDTLESEVGTDLQMAISTTFGPTILSEQAYLRFAQDPGVAPLETLTATTLFLPSGPVPARLGKIPFMALIGEVGTDSDGRGPCREMYANARMRTPASCLDSDVDCPCPSNRKSCKAAALIEIQRDIDVAIVDSSLPLLQALRDELRPQIPELDGVIGVQAMLDLRVEFDYPNARLLMRCENLERCVTRQEVRSQSQIEEVRRCRDREEEIRVSYPDAGPIE